MQLRIVLAIALVFLLAAAPLFAGDRYISPSGNDANTPCETSGSPCKTFDFTIPLLELGETLWVAGTNDGNGTYTLATTGLPKFTCGAGGVIDGTAALPITIQALTERGPLLDGSLSPNRETVEIHSCDHWRIIGLRMQNGDQATELSWGDVFWVDGSSNITVRRNLIRRHNRYSNTGLLLFSNVSDSLVEENEFYEFTRGGIGVVAGSNNIFRRNYVNSRLVADIGGFGSNFPDVGDSGLSVYSNAGTANANIFENNISENNYFGFRIAAANDPTTGTRFYGNISLTDNHGLTFESREGDVEDGIAVNHVSINPTLHTGTVRPSGVWLRGVGETGSSCINCTVINSADIGILANEMQEWPPNVTTPVSTFTNSLALDNANEGFLISNQSTFTVTFAASSGNADNYSPDATNANITSEFTNDAGSPAPTNMGGASGCYAWVHPSSNLKAAGSGGADIGANILFRTINGILTTETLWDPTTGAFPHGAVVTGWNDAATFPGAVLEDIQTRLRINTAGCPFPAGYGGAGSPTITLVWPYPAQQVFQRPNGATMSIQWSSTDITGIVDLDYSIDNGATWTYIAGPAFDSSPYIFDANAAKVPATTEFLIRISQGPTQDFSDSVATVRGRYMK